MIREEGQCVRINGGNQPGYLVAYRAMEIAIERSKQTGASIVGVYNTSHCGMAGYYVDMARKADIIGLLFADCLPRITPEGGTEAILGTNPLAVGIPSNTVPLLFDMSTAAITNGDLLVAMREGEVGIKEILVPGERAYRQRETHLVSGIHLDDTLVSQLT